MDGAEWSDHGLSAQNDREQRAAGRSERRAPGPRSDRRELLAHIALSQKQQNASLATLTTSYERMFSLLGGSLENAHKRLAELQGAPGDRPTTTTLALPEKTVEEREESLQRARALEAVTGKLPDVIDAAIAALVSHFVPAEKSH